MPYNYKKQNGELMSVMSQGEKFIHQSPVNDELSALIKLLISKINGCHYCVDQRYRNRGIGKVVMEKLASFITSTFQDINEIVLTVNTDNPHAMALYRQQGYQYMGDSMFVGRPVHIMALTIK